MTWKEGEGNRVWLIFKAFQGVGSSSLDVLSREFSGDTE
jgi:hypothetical protein